MDDNNNHGNNGNGRPNPFIRLLNGEEVVISMGALIRAAQGNPNGMAAAFGDIAPAVEENAPADAAPAVADNNITANNNAGAGAEASDADADAEPEYYWRNIQAYIDNPSSCPRPRLQCAICLQGLYQPNISPASHRHTREPLEVLGCGHVIGRRCWGHVCINAAREGRSPTCPFCRASEVDWIWRYHARFDDEDDDEDEQPVRFAPAAWAMFRAMVAAGVVQVAPAA